MLMFSRPQSIPNRTEQLNIAEEYGIYSVDLYIWATKRKITERKINRRIGMEFIHAGKRAILFGWAIVIDRKSETKCAIELRMATGNQSNFRKASFPMK